MSAWAWTDEEELVIEKIQENESVPRAEAIRRMQRRKRDQRRAPDRFCQNPRCDRGDDGGPASVAHLRSDAMYCTEACKKAGQKSPNRQKQRSNRQCLCGSKGDKIGSKLPPYQEEESRA
jgi:hypothetical protein